MGREDKIPPALFKFGILTHFLEKKGGENGRKDVFSLIFG
jgi:hypothetical protein